MRGIIGHDVKIRCCCAGRIMGHSMMVVATNMTLETGRKLRLQRGYHVPFSSQILCHSQHRLQKRHAEYAAGRKCRQHKMPANLHNAQTIIRIHQCFSEISTALTSTPSLNQRSSAEISTSFPLICLFRIRPSSANVQSSRP